MRSHSEPLLILEPWAAVGADDWRQVVNLLSAVTPSAASPPAHRRRIPRPAAGRQLAGDCPPSPALRLAWPGN